MNLIHDNPGKSTFLMGIVLGICVTLSSVGAGLGYLVAGYVDGLLLVSLLAGSLTAIQLGTHVSSNVPEAILQKVLMALLLILGINYTFF